LAKPAHADHGVRILRPIGTLYARRSIVVSNRRVNGWVFDQLARDSAFEQIDVQRGLWRERSGQGIRLGDALSFIGRLSPPHLYRITQLLRQRSA